MKNKITTIALIIAIMGALTLTSCSKKLGCYYSAVSEKPGWAFMNAPGNRICNIQETTCLYE